MQAQCKFTLRKFGHNNGKINKNDNNNNNINININNSNCNCNCNSNNGSSSNNSLSGYTGLTRGSGRSLAAHADQRDGREEEHEHQGLGYHE